MALFLAITSCATKEEKDQEFIFKSIQSLQESDAKMARRNIERLLAHGSPKSNPLELESTARMRKSYLQGWVETVEDHARKKVISEEQKEKLLVFYRSELAYVEGVLAATERRRE